MVKVRTLEEMQNRPTCYEVCIDGKPVAYVAQKTKKMLLKIAQIHAEDILAVPGAAESLVKYSKNTGWVFGPVRVHFSGKTERDVRVKMEREKN